MNIMIIDRTDNTIFFYHLNICFHSKELVNTTKGPNNCHGYSACKINICYTVKRKKLSFTVICAYSRVCNGDMPFIADNLDN